MDINTVMGLEIHVSIFNSTKTFSKAPVNSYSWVSLGFPGTLPRISFNAIKQSIRLAHALKMDINSSYISFDRKNYFYYDLPRGYQITQFFNPIARNGYIELENKKKIIIKQLHLEEDTAKQTKHGHSVTMSFERLGNPLVEIVTDAVFSSFAEIDEFLTKLKSICLFLDISACEYEHGEMRVDLNISHRLPHSNETTPRSEVKNLNSINAIEKSIDFLTDKFINNKSSKESYTYTWVEKIFSCEIMRKKTDYKGYFYIPEANIPPISVNEQYLKNILSSVPDFDDFLSDLNNHQLSNKEIKHLMTNYKIFVDVKKTNEKLNDWKKSYIWRASIIEGIINANPQNNYNIIDLIKLIELIEIQGNVSSKNSKLMIQSLICENLSPKESFKLHKVTQIVDEAQLSKIFFEVLYDLDDQLEKLASNIPKFKNLIVSKSMEKTKGCASPNVISYLFEQNIFEYLKTKNIFVIKTK